jgi:peptidoglycan/xylan/chitin deacetylase (PgdA/CDA1 family)
MKNGKFVISLDFELMWGVRSKKNIDNYRKNILGVQSVIPKLLQTFDEHNVRATFATVGFLFCEKKSEINENLPICLPNYLNKSFSPYLGYFDQVGENASVDLYHFAPGLIKKILNSNNHEIGSHTFSHYYCLEKGQNIESFKADLTSAQKLANKFNIRFTSLVFPRNQFNNEYLDVCKDQGIICIRGNENSWLYKARNRGQDNILIRALRLIDSYINITGYNCYSDEILKDKFPIIIPSSRFLRPFSRKLKLFEGLRLKRIKSAMTYAAKNGKIFHIWWHPHNFGIDQDHNFAFLNKILDHFEELNGKYNFQSCTMTELAKITINGGL